MQSVAELKFLNVKSGHTYTHINHHALAG